MGFKGSAAARRRWLSGGESRRIVPPSTARVDTTRRPDPVPAAAEIIATTGPTRPALRRSPTGRRSRGRRRRARSAETCRAGRAVARDITATELAGEPIERCRPAPPATRNDRRVKCSRHGVRAGKRHRDISRSTPELPRRRPTQPPSTKPRRILTRPHPDGAKGVQPPRCTGCGVTCALRVERSDTTRCAPPWASQHAGDDDPMAAASSVLRYHQP